MRGIRFAKDKIPVEELVEDVVKEADIYIVECEVDGVIKTYKNRAHTPMEAVQNIFAYLKKRGWAFFLLDVHKEGEKSDKTK